MLLRDNAETHGYTTNFLHAKVIMVDDRWATIGSSDVGPFSLLLARKTNVVVWDSAVASELRGALKDIMARHTHRVLADAHTVRR